MFCNSRIWQLSSVPLNSGYIIPVITLFSTSSMFMNTFYFSRSHLQVILDHTMLPYSMLKKFPVVIPRSHSSIPSFFYQSLSRTSVTNNLYGIRISPTLSPRCSRWISSFSLDKPFLWGGQLSHSFSVEVFFNNKLCSSYPFY